MARLALVVLVVAGVALAEDAPRVAQREAKSPPSVAGRFEVVLYPAVPQLNAVYTQHLGTFGALVWHVDERIALQVTGGYNWRATETAFAAELVEKVRAEPRPAVALLSPWNLLLGLELLPVTADFSLLGKLASRFDVGVSGGVGVGGSRVQLNEARTLADGTRLLASTGDAGTRFMGAVGVAAHLRIGERLSVRLELRDVITSARVERINGCSATELHAIGRELWLHGDASRATVGGSCEVAAFSGPQALGDVARAELVVQPASTDVVHQLGLYAGVAFLF